MGLNLSFVQMYMYLITKKKEKQMNWNITEYNSLLRNEWVIRKCSFIDCS